MSAARLHFFQRCLFCGLLAAALLGTGCSTRTLLAAYSSYNSSPRQGFPADYIDYLRHARFTNGELDHLPASAIVFYGDATRYLHKIGYSDASIRSLKLGTADPSILRVVSGAETSFLIEQGLPGGGGITTQTAELAALGARRIVHIGTCCSLAGFGGDVVVGKASFKDAAAVLLSPGAPHQIDSLAHPDRSAVLELERALTRSGVQWNEGIGFTMPIYYYQPTGLYLDRLLNQRSRFRSDYIEMEEAAFFQMCETMKVAGASLVVPSDTVLLQNHELVHQFVPGQKTEAGLKAALQAAIQFFSGKEPVAAHIP